MDGQSRRARSTLNEVPPSAQDRTCCSALRSNPCARCAFCKGEADQQHPATTAAHQSLTFQESYEGGLELYLQVVVSQTTALANQRNDIDLMRRHLDASTLLIKARGGGWDVQQLPKL